MKPMAWCLVLAIFIMGVAPKAEAGLAFSQMIPLANTNGSSEPANIQKAIERKMVYERLKQYGFTGDEINSRLACLSDEQVRNLSLNLDQLRVGGEIASIFAVILVMATLGMLYFYFVQGPPEKK
jgi:hypothetical protein